MEDKYNELISEGKSDNEAIGIVISEFGNLDELADSLGIKSFVNPSQAMPAAKTLSRETAAAFLRDSAKQAYLTAFGVFALHPRKPWTDIQRMHSAFIRFT